MPVVTASANKSRVYVSTALETTQGVAVALDKSFLVASCNVKQNKARVANDIVSGYEAAMKRTVTGLSAGGQIVSPMEADLMGWLFKCLFGSAPYSSILVSPSTTVYEHIWNTWAAPATFTLIKQNAGISTYVEKFAGCGISKLSWASGPKVMVTADVEGLGVYALGDADPAVSAVAGEADYIGKKATLKIGGSAVPAGTLMTGLNITISPGNGVLDTAGSTDGSATRFDRKEQRIIGATFTLLEVDRTNLDDWLAETTQTYEFIFTEAILDAVNGLAGSVSIKFTKGQLVGAWESEVGPHGTFSVKMAIEGLIDTSTGFDVIVTQRDLLATH